MAYQQPRLEIVKDNLVRVYHPDIVEPSTYLTDNAAAAAIGITVKNNVGFAQYDILLFEGFGSKNAELKKVNAAVSAGSSITITGLTFPHGFNTPVNKLLFDKVEVSGATTATGSKTVVATLDLNVSGPFTDCIVTGTTYAYYFARYYNSLASSTYYGAYSDAISASDFTVNTVGYIRRLAFQNIDQDFAGKFKADWVYDQIYLCEEEVLKRKSRWSALVVRNYDLGNLATGDEKIALPSDIEDTQTNKSILGVRIGTRDNMGYIEWPEFEWIMQDVAISTNSLVSVSETTVTLADSRDFADSGSIYYNGTSYSYTSNNRSTGVLSGFTAFTVSIPAGSNIWQNISLSEPRRFSVNNGYLYWDVPPSSDYNGRNVWIDYYKTATRPTSDGATPIFKNPQLYINFLEMAIKKKKNGGEIKVTDASYIAFEREIAVELARDKNPIGARLVPNIPSLSTSRSPFPWRR